MSHKGSAFLGFVSAVAAVGAACWLYSRIREKEREELDEWLMEDEADTPKHPEETEVIYVRSDPNEILQSDAAEWKSLSDEDEVDIHFLLPDDEGLKKFQDALAKEGYSSRIESDAANKTATVILTGPMSEEEVMDFTLALQTAMKDCGALYQGFTFI